MTDERNFMLSHHPQKTNRTNVLIAPACRSCVTIHESFFTGIPTIEKEIHGQGGPKSHVPATDELNAKEPAVVGIPIDSSVAMLSLKSMTSANLPPFYRAGRYSLDYQRYPMKWTPTFSKPPFQISLSRQTIDIFSRCKMHKRAKGLVVLVDLSQIDIYNPCARNRTALEKLGKLLNTILVDIENRGGLLRQGNVLLLIVAKTVSSQSSGLMAAMRSDSGQWEAGMLVAVWISWMPWYRTRLSDMFTGILYPSGST